MTYQKFDSREALIKMIHAKARELGFDDATYRQMLETVTGKTSCGKMTQTQLEAVKKHLRSKGAPARKYDGRRRSTPAENTAKLHGKITALLAELHRVTGEPYTLPYADAICKRLGGPDRIDFADALALKRVIAALVRSLKSKEASRAADQ